MSQVDLQKKIAQIKAEASRVMHLHYCENDVEGVISTFGPELTWFGAGEEQYAVGRDAVTAYFRQFKGAIAKCTIHEEEYDAFEAAPDLFVCTGRMWIATDPASEMYLKVHQRMTFVYRWTPERITCVHMHCSNPYMELMEGEEFPERIGKQSYAYVQESLFRLEAEMRQKNRQMEIIMSSISGGLAVCEAEEPYAYRYISEEAAALFGYTVEELLSVTGGNGIGVIYPPDRDAAIRGFRENFKNGRTDYAQKYRVQCRDGSLKWVLDTGSKAINENGEAILNTLYLDITKSEEDAEELHRQQELLSSIYSTVPCGILRLQKEGEVYRLISINPAGIHLLGLDAGLLERCDWSDGVVDTVLREDRHILLDSYQKLKGLGDRVWMEYRVQWPDGSIHCLKGSSLLVSLGEGGQVIQRMFIDVTESRELEEQLTREREMYRLAMESSSDVMYEYIMSADTLVTYAPKTDANGCSYVDRKVLSHFRTLLQTQEIIASQDIQTVLDNICNGRCQPFDCRFRAPHDQHGEDYWWYHVTGTLISREGAPYRVVGTLRNIQKEKQAFRANIQELQMNRAALQAINRSYLGIYYVDLIEDWSYGLCLPGMERAAQDERQQHFYQRTRDYIAECVEDAYKEQLYALLDSKKLSQLLHNPYDRTGIEYREYRRGVGQWLRMEVHLISCEENRIRNLVLTFRDVTDERRRELERKQEEEKAKQALQDAYESARQANVAKSDFLSRMSHDIRTPMNAVVGMTTIAENNLNDVERLKDCLSKIRMSSNLLLQLINEVLDMSKIESGNVQLNVAPFSIEDLIHGTCEILRPELAEKQLSFALETARLSHNAVEGDAVRVQQILLNLLSNAVKYTPQGGHIRLTADELLCTESGTGCFQFVVEDDGIGIPEPFLNRLFVPFERAGDVRVSAVQGTGLGLPIAQNLVHMMGGTIEVKSCLDQGSRFAVTIYLKLAEGSALSGQQERKTAPQPSVQGGRRILLVDDNLLNREIARELLEMEHLIVEEAVNGKMAVERFRDSPPGYYDLILMDIQMPVLDGYQATRAIRRLNRPDASVIPIVALTANAFADDILAAKQAGMNLHLAKPFHIQQIMAVLNQCWDSPPETT